jgi:hypothetical protein
MDKLVIQPTELAQWHSLIHEAEGVCHTQLGEELQSYLVFLLMRYTTTSELANAILALEYLNSLQSSGKMREEQLRDVGDKCLLYSGLFPGRAERRRVKISYYVHLGVGAYASLAHLLAGVKAKIFSKLSDQFVLLMDILHAIREVNTAKPTLQPLQAMELWNDTGSAHALATLARYTQAIPVKLTVTSSTASTGRTIRRGKSSHH